MTTKSGGGGWFFVVIPCSLLLVVLMYALLPEYPVHRVASREIYALGRLRKIDTSQQEFLRVHGSFADSLDSLRDLGPAKSDYIYALEITAREERGRPAKYVVRASPRVPNETGVRYFAVDETGAIRWDTHPVTPQSPLLQ